MGKGSLPPEAAAGQETVPLLSVVLPIFNEEAIIPELCRRLCSVVEELPGPCEIILRKMWSDSDYV